MSGAENTVETFIGNVNPIRYRGYYYDEESGLYYLQSRYYDPEVGRFINADEIDYIEPDTLMGCNLYAYCGNNPVSRIDAYGTSWNSFVNWLKRAGNGIKNFFTKTIPDWWNNTVVSWWNNEAKPFLSMLFSFDGLKNFFSGKTEGTLYAYLYRKVKIWWDDVSFNIQKWWQGVSLDVYNNWMKLWLIPFENGLHNFAEFIQTNPIYNAAIFIGGLFISGFSSFLAAALSFWAYLVNGINDSRR